MDGQFEGMPNFIDANTLTGAWAMGILIGTDRLKMSLTIVAGGVAVCQMQR